MVFDTANVPVDPGRRETRPKGPRGWSPTVTRWTSGAPASSGLAHAGSSGGPDQNALTGRLDDQLHGPLRSIHGIRRL